MPPPFPQVNVAEFGELVARFPFKRHLNAVHMHHTWRPNHAQYRGHDTIVSMWRHHTQVNGWSDIAQHISIAPDGSIWLGRNWNQPPASAAGHNGNTQAGPFMFEIIGDFDLGKDPFDGAQRETVLQVIRTVQQRFELPPETLLFHNMMSSKTCPGSAIDYAAFLEEVRQRHAQAERTARARPSAERDLPFPESFEAPAGRIARTLELLTRDVPAARGESGDAEHEDQSEMALEQRERGGGERDSDLTVEMLNALRAHVINLREGKFSEEGQMATSKEDVDAMFGDHLERALREVKAKDPAGKLRLLFYAHGGLVSESAGLRIAHKHLGWWQANGVYPINFVWETGLWEIIADLLRKTKQQGERGVISDFITDPIIETALRVLPAQTIWSGMKRSAEQANAAEGGARYAAEKLRAFCDRHAADLELHAVGHSAGSIFHSHFLPACNALAVPSFKSLHFLAPAVRVDTFLDRLGSLLKAGKAVDYLTVFTMTKQYERKDNCASIYRKSLLYLVSASCEPEGGTPLLGLEESLRKSVDCRALLGLDGAPSRLGEVVWSKTDHTEGRSASCSTSHGGFDDDAATLDSVVRRVLGKADADPVVPYVPLAREGARGVDWAEQIDWPEPLRTVRDRPVRPAFWTSTASAAGSVAPAAGGRRLALCIGIDNYPVRPLAGCVADARMWVDTLRSLGFDSPRMLLDAAATRSAIAQAMEQIIADAKAGDVVVIQYSGHGTQVQDLDGDEAEGDTPGQDEALCPIDFVDGAFLIDDDIGAMCARIGDGVNVTFFTDCCHSGTVTRLGVGMPGGASGARDERARFIPASAEMDAAHARFRARIGPARAASRASGTQREVLFSACRSSEVAWESDGHGEFTVRTTAILQRGVQGLTHEAFQGQILQAFGAQPRQHPELHCAPDATGRPLLGGIGVAATAAPSGQAAGGAPPTGLLASLEALLSKYRGPA